MSSRRRCGSIVFKLGALLKFAERKISGLTKYSVPLVFPCDNIIPLSTSLSNHPLVGFTPLRSRSFDRVTIISTGEAKKLQRVMSYVVAVEKVRALESAPRPHNAFP